MILPNFHFFKKGGISHVSMSLKIVLHALFNSVKGEIHIPIPEVLSFDTNHESWY